MGGAEWSDYIPVTTVNDGGNRINLINFGYLQTGTELGTKVFGFS
jgi:hypothetical protein